MALRFSKGLRNFLNEGGSIKHALAGGKLLIYSGSQPTTADDAVAGTLLVTLTVGGAAHTVEVQATGSVTLTGGASGSVNTVTVNSIDILGAAVSFNTSLTQTAADVASQINNNRKNYMYSAANNGTTTITITAKPGHGTLVNGHAVSTTLTTITTSHVNIGSGVAGVNSVNGLTFGDSAAGTLVKSSIETWSGTAVSTGTAGWFRFVGAVVDAGGTDASEVFIRLDGNVATSGANLNMASTSITSGVIQTLNTFSLTYPATGS